jgi:PleD family two-component response regulator
MTMPMHDDAGGAVPQTEPLRVLIVDDSEDEADSLATLLAFRRYEVQRAYSANAALELARRFRPAAFLLDLGLPGMSGYELAHEVDPNYWTSKRVVLGGLVKRPAAPFQRAAPAAALRLGLGSD